MSRGTGRVLAGMMLLGAAGLTASCQSKDALSSAATPPKEKITQSELVAFCPPIGLRQGTAFFTSYEQAAPVRPAKRGAPATADAAPPAEDAAYTDKPAKRVVYQTAITDVTRACKRENGVVTMTIGVAGRVVPGPAAKGGALQLPIRIAVTAGDQVIFSRLYRHSVQVANLSSATQFLFTATDVSFPEPVARGTRGFAGFDEGPPSKDTDSGDSDLPPGQ